MTGASRRNFLRKIVFIAAVSCSSFIFTGLSNAENDKIGTLRVTNQSGATVLLSEDELLNLPRSSIRTQTAWTEGVHHFEGVALTEILKKAGIKVSAFTPETLLRLTAWNDYIVDITLRDATDYQTLLAAFMDGKRLTIKDKGPYWLVYPRDDHSELQDSRFDHRWSWQLKELTIK